MAVLSDITNKVTNRFKTNENVLSTAFVYNDSGTLEGKGGCWYADKNSLGDNADVPVPGNDYVVFQIGMRNKADRTQFYCDGNTFSKRQVDNTSDDAFSEWVQQNKAVLLDSYKSSNSWYRTYSDGWIEQGGQATITSTGTITFPIAFGTKCITCISHPYNQPTNATSDNNYISKALSITKTNFVIKYWDSDSTAGRTGICSWYACGY